ncbi:PrsW family glutamic-type intramembrane protease [Aeoliella mucimassa]|uniref:Protease PrsW n=1 Tax=Aeoliella mucimassa TaxID=2527972 RepID=A0A518AM60_9BACT|nr:PrsW family glutamic-type intramembrane protease [Aeoliella mucimassa]QDU55798.1 hypothetical protein Pan181_19940 [Aeoliella mucimassa]
MPKPDHNPSIEHEPQFKADLFELDPSEWKAEQVLAHQASRSTDDDAVEHVVWDEPALSPDFSGKPDESQLTYDRWLTKHVEAMPWGLSWLITLGVAIVSGPLAIVGTLFTPHGYSALTASSIVVVSIIGPTIEEFMKVAFALWVIEKRPYWFRSIPQILLCAIAGGILFGVIENLMYLHLYIPGANAELARWRWTVCIGLHMNCSFVAGIGLARIWDNCIREKHRPLLGLGTPWMFIAIVGHGLYNFCVTVAEVMGWLDFAS